MSAVASPRDSSSIRSPSSSRTSLDLPATSRPQLAQQQSQRRNRAALRDYYGLKAATEASNEASHEPQTALPREVIPTSELDREGFDAPSYVKSVLATQDLEHVLKAEGDLISEIKNLDGERKALVYDNYSKLIAATDTIKRMRSNLDPLTPATSTLSPAIAHIADTAAALSSSLIERTSKAQEGTAGTLNAEGASSQKQTVRWVLGTPQRIQAHIDQENVTAAAAEYQEVLPLLERWEGVGGVAELRARCQALLPPS